MRKAFSLVELSIVLVILGLLVGGILAGQSLIRAAELRAVSGEYNRYQTAVNAFRDKYFGLPGDLTNATSFWGAADGSTGLTAGCATTQGTGTTTCNGNGDGQVSTPTGANERFRFWQHLTNAGLIEGNYTGVAGSGGAAHATTANAPSSKFPNGQWFTTWGGAITGSSNSADAYFTGDWGNYMELGAPYANFHPITPILKSEELWNIDTKIDDGKPATGKINARRYDTCTNATSPTDYAASYSLNSSTVGCVALFIRVY